MGGRCRRDGRKQGRGGGTDENEGTRRPAASGRWPPASLACLRRLFNTVSTRFLIELALARTGFYRVFLLFT